jgi:autophagy-related protein 9
MDDDSDLEQGLTHFVDVPQNDDGSKKEEASGHDVAGICGSMPVSLNVRIIPRGSDPI